MITQREYEKALSIVEQYIDEQKALISEGEALLGDKHPIAKNGEYIEITSVHTSGSPKYLSVGVKLRVSSAWKRDSIVRCRGAINGKKGYLLINSRNYDWKISEG